MFKKLRNRFLIVNLVSISVMMLVAFITIYIITYQNVQRETNMELYKVSDFYHSPYSPSGSQIPRGEGQGGGSDSGTGSAAGSNDDTGTGASGSASGSDESSRSSAGSISSAMPSFAGRGGSGGMAGGKFGMNRGPGGDPNAPPARSVSFMIQTDAYWNITGTHSRFDMEESFYKEAIQKVDRGSLTQGERQTGQFALDGADWAYVVDPSGEGYMIVFMDVTAQQGILTNLIYTFAVVGLVMLIVIYFLSRYFANRSIAPVREAFEKQKQFIADASHELKTPLAIINTNTDVLLANQEDTIVNQAKWLHYIKAETERMSGLTSDLLYLTQMEEARSSLIHTTFNMSDAVESIILPMEAVIFEKNISLDYNIEPNLNVHGNGEQIKQVILILLDNAVKYSGPKGSVNVTLQKQNYDVLLTVANTGEGIAPEHLDRIFDRFYRTDSSRARKHGGHGLGLAIARSIVEQHKGEIYAKSVVGEGASFHVRLS
ncbi:HAMP domain-containing histidine kinase [Paenibacillus barcinonensis]|uniref:histidine kinase n=1 Tax=Paenibacillus barcinonensis TaxID=198119 RepID=A0A2V4VDE5_PAEBA|nr:HAMP domain-containing sensor histidine kinase [Paenibacillus barcinonensis]PYE44272.1 phospho-acceptor domain-containing protein [Paenibacillus barcinonensis]QKS57642.1 HAMP domain-containing histidine kinase [Paenibacillus barcinonensis]